MILCGDCGGCLSPITALVGAGTAETQGVVRTADGHTRTHYLREQVRTIQPVSKQVTAPGGFTFNSSYLYIQHLEPMHRMVHVGYGSPEQRPRPLSGGQACAKVLGIFPSTLYGLQILRTGFLYGVWGSTCSTCLLSYTCCATVEAFSLIIIIIKRKTREGRQHFRNNH